LAVGGSRRRASRRSPDHSHWTTGLRKNDAGRDSAEGAWYDGHIHGVEPRLDPALNRLIDERIRTVDRSKGVILDGYPASKEQGDHVAGLISEFQFSGPIVLQLRLTDADVRKRASQNGTKDVEQGLKDYHRELDFAQTYFPQAHIHAINGARPVPEVAKEIRKVLTSVK
jgi:Adenylate kinase